MQIRLKVEHMHGERSYPPGSVLEVDKPTGDWLVKHQIGEAVPIPAKPETDKKEAGK